MEITFDGGKVVTAHSHGHIIKTDQPVHSGGQNSAPSPYELSFCDNRNIPTDNIKIIQSAEFDEKSGLPVNIKLDIKLPSDFPEKYKEAVISVAELCKVKKTMASPPVFEVIASTV
jgi:ribosomal protein S12 methylthiotransferase accessory factor